MAWSRLEPGFSQHVKRLKSGPIASWLWVCAIDFCTLHGTDGFVDSVALAGLCPSLRPAERKRAIKVLVDVGSFEERDGGVYVHGYLDHNPSKAQVEKDRAASRTRYDRWRERRQASDGDPNGAANAVANAVYNGAAATPTVGQSFGQSVIPSERERAAPPSGDASQGDGEPGAERHTARKVKL